MCSFKVDGDVYPARFNFRAENKFSDTKNRARLSSVTSSSAIDAWRACAVLHEATHALEDSGIKRTDSEVHAYNEGTACLQNVFDGNCQSETDSEFCEDVKDLILFSSAGIAFNACLGSGTNKTLCYLACVTESGTSAEACENFLRCMSVLRSKAVGQMLRFADLRMPK